MKANLLPAKKIAEYLGVKESTIRYWVHIGYIPHIKFSGAVRFNLEAIDEWLIGRQKGGTFTRAREISDKIMRKERRPHLDRRG
jgi:excisionase family DNA binding protein